MSAGPSLVGYFASQHRRRTAVMVVLLALAGLLEGLGLAAALPVLNSVTGSDQAPDDRVSEIVDAVLGSVGLESTLGVLLAVLVCFMTMKGAVLIIAMRTVGFVVAEVAMELRLRLLRAMASAEWGHVLRYPKGFITNAISSEAQRVANAYREFCGALADGAQVTMYLVLVFLISWETASLALLAGAGILALLKGFVGQMRNAGTQQTELMRAVLSRMTDVLPGLKPLKGMGREGYLLPLLERDTRSFFTAQRKEIISREVLFKVREPLVVAVLAIGLWTVLTWSDLSFPAVMVMALLFYRTVSGITNIQGRWATVALGESAFESMMGHIAEAEAMRESWPGVNPAPILQESLCFDRVSFSYGERPVLRGVSLRLRSGRFVVLTGPSGGGKSTLIDLITGLLKPTSGSITVDGSNLADVDMQAWRSHIGYVPQDILLVSDTIRRNVTLGDESFEDDDVWEALRKAGALDFVQELRGGLDHRVGEGGTTLSGGQRQRISIARALVVQPRLLVLDEPTTALDTRSEQEVVTSILSLKGHLTVLAVSHQLALREVADEIWELRDGRLEVCGPSDAHALGAPS